MSCLHDLETRFGPALAAAEEICENLTEDVIDLKDKPFIRYDGRIFFDEDPRVGAVWQVAPDCGEAPMPGKTDLYCVSASMHHYAKGVAHAAMKF